MDVPREPRPLDEQEELAVDELGRRVLERARKDKLGPASAPTMSLRVLNLVATPGAEISEMARLISADPALSAGVLKVANSAAVRGVREIETVRDAIARLGLEEVGRVAGALAARSLFNPRIKTQLEGGGEIFGLLYRRAVVVASAAADLAMRVRARPDRAFLGGMLHDVGRTVALHAFLEGLPPGARPGPLELQRMRRMVDRIHVELGAEIHQDWDLPQYLTVLAVRHHDPVVPGDEEFRDLHVVRLVAALHDLAHDDAAAWRASLELAQSAGALKMSPVAVRAAAADLRQAEGRVQATFGL
jgi:putative nucleotidyltransferase with HDIG domain